MQFNHSSVGKKPNQNTGNKEQTCISTTMMGSAVFQVLRAANTGNNQHMVTL